MRICAALAVLLAAASTSASERAGGYSISVRAVAAGPAVVVDAHPAGAVVEKAQVKLYSVRGALLATANAPGDGTGTLVVHGLDLEGVDSVEVQANVRASAIAARTGVCTAMAPVVRHAEVSIIAGDQRFPWGLTVTPGAVYWAERWDSPWDGSPATANGAIWTANLDGSDPHKIATGQSAPMGIAADAAAVYWTNAGDGSVKRFDLASRQITTLAANQGFVGTAILAVNGSLVWSGMGLQALRAGDSTPTHLGWYGAVNMASDGTNLFWTDYGNYPEAPGGSVWSMPLAGGARVALVSGQPQTWDVHVQTGQVYWSNQAWLQSFPASINRVPSNGGEPSTVSTGNEIMKVFAVDAQNAYYVSDWTLYAAPLGGGEPRVLAELSAGGCPQGKMAVRGRNLYWTDTCSQAVLRASW